MYKVLVTHNIPGDGLSELRQRCQVVTPPEGQLAFSRQQILEHMADVDGVLACAAIDAEMIAAAPKLKIISNYGAGYDRIDTAAAAARGIPVTNIPDDTMQATAELALALLMSLSRRVTELDRALRAGEQGLFVMGQHMGHTLSGKTLGIIGMGHIGGALAGMARALGMDVVYHNRHRLPPEREQGCRYMELDALLECADAISLHCPLTDSTRNLIGRAQIERMKPSAVIVNTARGGVIDTAALIDALKSGRIAGAALDVFPSEPEVPTELLSMDNVVLTPHIGTNAVETREQMARACAARILDALDGRTPANVVNGVKLA